MAPTKLTHSIRLDPATATRLKVFAADEGVTMNAAVELLLDAAGAPRESLMPAAVWAGEPHTASHFLAMRDAAEAAGNTRLAAFAAKRLKQIEMGSQDE